MITALELPSGSLTNAFRAVANFSLFIYIYIYVCVCLCMLHEKLAKTGWEEVITLYVLLNWVETEMTLKYKYSLPGNPKLLVGINIWNTKFNCKSKQQQQQQQQFPFTYYYCTTREKQTQTLAICHQYSFGIYIKQNTKTFWAIDTTPCMF